MNTSIEKSNIQFLNVIYVLNFIINIVVENILENKKFYFDIQHRHFHWNNFVVIYVLKIENHYVFENNREFEEIIAFATFIRINFTYDWHQFFVHVNNELIQYLTTIVKEIKFIDKESILKINKCETCTFVKAHKIVSRFFEKSKISKKLFFRIIYDLIIMNTIINKN